MKAFEESAIQDCDPGVCFGCGAMNDAGLQIKSYLDGEECVCTWSPASYHSAGRNILYGGIIASLIDCHSAATAQALAYRIEDRPVGSEPRLHYVTKSLQVEYLKPTPLEGPVTLRARVAKFQGRGAQVHCDLSVNGEVCARGDSLFVRVPAEPR